MGIRIVIGFLLISIIGYGLTEVWPLFQGPRITLSSPAHFSGSQDGFVHLQGVAKNTETLLVNGHLLLIDEQGNFDTSLLFPQGGSILVLKATDRFGKEITEERSIYAL